VDARPRRLAAGGMPVLLGRWLTLAVGLLPAEDVDDAADLPFGVVGVPLHDLHEDEPLPEQVVRPLLSHGFPDLGDAGVWRLHSLSPLLPSPSVCHGLPRGGPLLTGRSCFSASAFASFCVLQTNSRTV
jgi:hypothetical protein